MMVLIDTTVWIDFFAGRQQPHVTVLERLIKNREDICICGIILTEVLQGIRYKAPLVTLDRKLKIAAQKLKVAIVEV